MWPGSDLTWPDRRLLATGRWILTSDLTSSRRQVTTRWSSWTVSPASTRATWRCGPSRETWCRPTLYPAPSRRGLSTRWAEREERVESYIFLCPGRVAPAPHGLPLSVVESRWLVIWVWLDLHNCTDFCPSPFRVAWHEKETVHMPAEVTGHATPASVHASV